MYAPSPAQSRQLELEFIANYFPNLEQLVVTFGGFMDSRLHLLFKSLLCRGVNAVAGTFRLGYTNFYLGSDASFLSKYLHGLKYHKQDCYVYITQSPDMEHRLPVLVETILSGPGPRALDLLDGPRTLPRIHLATNFAKISPDLDVERLKVALKGITSFSIWRDGDEEEEATESEKEAVNMILQGMKGKLTRVSMPKVNFMDIESTMLLP